MNNQKLSASNSRINLLEILSKFPNQKIAVIGDIILDKYVYGDVDRISQEAPVPIVKVTSEKYVPGGAANVAANIVTLGGEAFLFGIVGNDNDKEIVINKIKEGNIHTDGILIEENRKTIRKTRIIGLNQQLLRIDYEDTKYVDNKFEDKVLKKLKDIKYLSTIIVSDYAKGAITKDLLTKLLELSKENGIPIIVDPKPKHKSWYKNALLITPNRKEAQEMSGVTIETEDDYIIAGKKLLQEMSSNIIITAGSDGMNIFENDSIPVHLNTEAKEVYDVSGAGDTVVATLALGIGSKASVLEASQLANIAAGIKVGKAGTQPVYIDELKNEC